MTTKILILIFPLKHYLFNTIVDFCDETAFHRVWYVPFSSTRTPRVPPAKIRLTAFLARSALSQIVYDNKKPLFVEMFAFPIAFLSAVISRTCITEVSLIQDILGTRAYDREHNFVCSSRKRDFSILWCSKGSSPVANRDCSAAQKVAMAMWKNWRVVLRADEIWEMTLSKFAGARSEFLGKKLFTQHRVTWFIWLL